MFLAYGTAKYACATCGQKYAFPADRVEFEQDGGDDRGMGAELLHAWRWTEDCKKCGEEHSLEITLSEYPIGILNHITKDSEGVTVDTWPRVDQVHAYYVLPDDTAEEAEKSIQEVIAGLQADPGGVRDIDPRQFEEVVAELFRNAGYEVELTPRSKDGGKDIIAIQKNVILGIETKLFVECKRYAEDNVVGVELVRGVYGVLNERDGPNKSVIVTTSRFTSGAKEFATEKTASKYDLKLVDFDELTGWIRGYKPSGIDWRR